MPAFKYSLWAPSLALQKAISLVADRNGDGLLPAGSIKSYVQTIQEVSELGRFPRFYCYPKTGLFVTAEDIEEARAYETAGFIEVKSHIECIQKVFEFRQSTEVSIPEQSTRIYCFNPDLPCYIPQEGQEFPKVYCYPKTGLYITAESMEEAMAFERAGFVEVKSPGECVQKTLIGMNVPKIQEGLDIDIPVQVGGLLTVKEEEGETVEIKKSYDVEESRAVKEIREFYDVEEGGTENEINVVETIEQECQPTLVNLCNPATGAFTVATDTCQLNMLLNSGFIMVSSAGECARLSRGLMPQNEDSSKDIIMFLTIGLAGVAVFLAMRRMRNKE